MTDTATSSRQSPAAVSTAFDNVAVIAAGTIGMSWTALFLAHGLSVRVYDPRPGIEEVVRSGVAQMAPPPSACLPTI